MGVCLCVCAAYGQPANCRVLAEKKKQGDKRETKKRRKKAK